MAQWAPVNPAIPRSPESSAQVKSHLHSVTEPSKAKAVPSDMQSSFRNRGRRGSKERSHCRHWKLVCCFQNCIRCAKTLLAPACMLAHLIWFPMWSVTAHAGCSVELAVSTPVLFGLLPKITPVQGPLSPSKYQTIFTYASSPQFGKKKLIHPRALWSSDKSFPD